MTPQPSRSASPTRRRLGRLRHPLRLAGHLLIVRQIDRSLRFRSRERFGYELPDRRRFFRHVFHYLDFNGIDGDYAEFGSHGAYTFRMAFHSSRLAGRQTHLWAFDSFEGLPQGADDRDTHPQWLEGTMSTSEEQFHRVCAKAGIDRQSYTTVTGYYSSTLAPDADGERPKSVAFAYVDCDLFSSTVDALRFLESRLRPGSVVAFDDYYCYAPDGPSGERRAARAHFADSAWSLVPYIQYGWAGMSFVVERRSDSAAHESHW